ncbi:MAG TPA: aminotransferase class III-fold pyridoxal phosphate-dependent enzyme, partial [Leucothrix sp.]|nr:aminotransferase class III-fold pyridoxal phosphate-dependent enzyme [Leucothrix sp.]
MSNHLMSTYARLPVAFKSGRSVYLTDTEGKEYLDAICGIAVCGLGHAHPDVARDIADQAKTLIHTSNLYEIPHQTELGEKLCTLADMDKVFFSNSGAEANEAAIKLARLYGKQQGIERPNIIVANGSFHGRTLATLSATGNR